MSRKAFQLGEPFLILIFATRSSRIRLVDWRLYIMAEITKVAVDAMGGDNAPGEIVKGAVDAIAKDKNIKVFLVGREEIY